MYLLTCVSAALRMLLLLRVCVLPSCACSGSSSRCVVDGRQLMEDGQSYCSIRCVGVADRGGEGNLGHARVLWHAVLRKVAG